ncbi:hypothetical protein AAMO2058_000902000 [Amorphochlora amoebiformis]
MGGPSVTMVIWLFWGFVASSDEEREQGLADKRARDRAVHKDIHPDALRTQNFHLALTSKPKDYQPESQEPWDKSSAGNFYVEDSTIYLVFLASSFSIVLAGLGLHTVFSFCGQSCLQKDKNM